MKIGILTFHRAHNCGAMLQAYALKTILERMGHVVDFPACNQVGDEPRFHSMWHERPTLFRRFKSFAFYFLYNLLSIGVADGKWLRFRRFRQKYLPERKCIPSEFERIYDCLFVGSDQVWNPLCAHEVDAPLFLLENFVFTKPIVAYAVSCGDNPLDADAKNRVSAAACKCIALGGREESVFGYTGREGAGLRQVTPDPTLLLTRDDYRKLLLPVRKGRRPLVYCYLLEDTAFALSVCREMSMRLNADCRIMCPAVFSRWNAPRGLDYGLSPQRLISEIQHADYVVASSFHGTVFSLLFRKKFISLRNKVDDNISRPGALLARIGLSDHLMNPSHSFEEMAMVLQRDIPLEAYRELETFRQQGLRFIRDAMMAVEKKGSRK